MASRAERIAQAQRHVDGGRKVIAQQRGLIASQKAAGRDTAAAEDLLSCFEQTQKIFEDDLVLILNER